MTSHRFVPTPGWYVQLEGHEFDLEDWRHSLNDPFDPVAEKLPDGKTVLSSSDFHGLEEANEVRERALVLIARLNGAIGIWNEARPVRLGGVLQIDEHGNQHAWVFGALATSEGRCKAMAVGLALGPNGEPLPPPPPQPSQPQLWNSLAEHNDDVSDLLDQFGRADNWYDIYKTLEIAAHIQRGKHKLWRLLDAEAGSCRNLDQTANYYRHARGAKRPTKPTALHNAKPLLAYIVRSVLEEELARPHKKLPM